MGGFLRELRHRHVVRVAIAYVVAAWLLLQVTDTLVPMLELPVWSGRLVLLLLGVGLIPAVILAWSYEITTRGVMRDEDVDRSLSVTRSSGRKLDFMIIAALAVALGGVIWTNYFSGPDQSDKSIAVLPFENMSADPNNEYFSDGLSDTLLHKLAQIQDLTVPARTSSFQFKNKAIDAKEIGRQLNVAYVLEGSVQKSNDQLRVIAQLIETETGTHVSSMTFDRPLADVFAIQDEIAAEVVASLRLTLLEDEHDRLQRRETEDIAAYEEYLIGRRLLIDVNTPDSMRQAVGHFENSTNLDPEFVQAYVGEAKSWMWLTDVGAVDITTSTRNVRRLRPEIFSRDQDSPDLHLIDGWIAWMGGDGSKADQEFKQHLERAESVGDGFYWYAYFLINQVRFVDAIDVATRGLDIDPLNPTIENVLSWAIMGHGDFERSINLQRDIIDRYPDFADVLGSMPNDWYRAYGDIPEAIRVRNQYCAIVLPDRPPSACGFEFWLALKDWETIDKNVEEFDHELFPEYRLFLPELVLERENAASAIEMAKVQLGHPLQRWHSLVKFVRIIRLDGSLSDEDILGLYERHFPKLLSNRRFDEQVFNWSVGRYASVYAAAAVDYAGLLIKAGEIARAADYIGDAEAFIAKSPRLGVWGYGILDVELAAMQGIKEEALDALETAINEGWMIDWWFNAKYNPNLARLHDEPRYQALIQRLSDKAAQQLEQVRAREAANSN